jgi:hypothetical protein
MILFMGVVKMTRKSARNDDLLKSSKADTNPKIYAVLVDLVNRDRKDLAEMVLEIDRLLEYTSTCIRQRDYREARDVLLKTKYRMDILRENEVDMEYLDHLYGGIAKKAKIK